MSIEIILLLVCSGVVVGVINTFAGAAASITIALYTALGMPIAVANGTNRVSVLMQTATMSFGFRKQGLLDYRTGLKLGIPTFIGAVIGATFAARVNATLFVWMLVTLLMLLLLLLVFSPDRILKGSNKPRRAIRWSDYGWFLLIGLYGGAFHIGIGYLILSVTIMAMGYDVLQANALKGFVVMLYTPVALSIFLFHDQVNLMYGLVHGAGNIVGAYFATRYASRINPQVIRWVLVAFMLFTILELLGVIDLKSLFANWIP